MVNKIDFILDLLEDPISSSNSGLAFLRAFIGALDANKTSELLIYSISNDLQLRDLINRKIEFDLGDGKGFLYEDVAFKLLQIAKTSRYNIALSSIISLSTIFPSLKTDIQLDILEFLTTSSRILFRRKAYKLMLDNYKGEYKNILTSVWMAHQEVECCHVMIQHLDAALLLNFRYTLLTVCKEGWLISKLYVKLGKEYPELLHELRSYNTETYCYCLWKLNLKLHSISSEELLKQCRDQNFLIWCLGRLAEWELIMKIFSITEFKPQN
ncbi:hypothetical protein D3C78_778870 [compost metagenome]